MPNKELFNQPLKTSLEDSDRIAVGIPGITGAYNIEFSRFRINYGLSTLFRARNSTNIVCVIEANSKLLSIDVRNNSINPVTITITSTDSEFNFGSFDVGANSTFELVVNRNKINGYTLTITATQYIDVNIFYLKNIWQ